MLIEKKSCWWKALNMQKRWNNWSNLWNIWWIISKKGHKTGQTKGIPLENITISSDGYGSFSDYDEYGNLLKIGVSSVSNLLLELVKMVKEEKLELEEALMFFTTNVAKALSLYPKKGTIKEGSDADLLILNKDMELISVIAKGKLMMDDSKVIVRGTYE